MVSTVLVWNLYISAKLWGSKSARIGGVRDVDMKLISRQVSLLGASGFVGWVFSSVAVPSKTNSKLGAFES